MEQGTDEPLYDLNTKTWTHLCPCIIAEQRDPECPWHGRLNESNQAELTPQPATGCAGPTCWPQHSSPTPQPSTKEYQNDRNNHHR